MPRETDECSAAYRNNIVVDALAQSIEWDHCLEGSLKQGRRFFQGEEISLVQKALSKIEIGSREDCGADKPTITLDIEYSDRVSRYADDFYSCEPAPEGRTFVRNIDELTFLLRKYASDE